MSLKIIKADITKLKVDAMEITIALFGDDLMNLARSLYPELL